jgi:hypothetical protein
MLLEHWAGALRTNGKRVRQARRKDVVIECIVIGAWKMGTAPL